MEDVKRDGEDGKMEGYGPAQSNRMCYSHINIYVVQRREMKDECDWIKKHNHG